MKERRGDWEVCVYLSLYVRRYSRPLRLKVKEVEREEREGQIDIVCAFVYLFFIILPDDFDKLMQKKSVC